MDKLLVLSVVFMTVLVAERAARDPKPGRGLLRALVVMAAFNLVYLLSLFYVLPRLF